MHTMQLKQIKNVIFDAINRAVRDMFVDNFITVVNNVDEGWRVDNKVTELPASTGFRLTKMELK